MQGRSPRGWRLTRSGSIAAMKKLIFLVALVVIGAIVYKVLTTEIPIDE